jgi:hypothetical protein
MLATRSVHTKRAFFKYYINLFYSVCLIKPIIIFYKFNSMSVCQNLCFFLAFFKETTARLLFMAVRWVRCLAPFQTLSKRDQVGDLIFVYKGLILRIEFSQLLLLQESWKELFLLHLAQWSIPWDLSSLLNCSKARERIPNDEITNIELITIQVNIIFQCIKEGD